MGQLASGYRDGWNVPKDLDLATKWFERAADFTVEAMYQSYLMYSQEHGSASIVCQFFPMEFRGVVLTSD